MFINCPNCNALVATDLANNLPPERCPRCAFALLGDDAHAPSPAPAATPLAPASPAAPGRRISGQPVFVPLKPSRPAGTGHEATPDPAPAPEPEPEPESEPESFPPEPSTVAETAGHADPSPPAPPVPTPAAQPSAPHFLARPRPAGDTGRGRRPIAIAAGLALLLIVQLLLADRVRLASSTGWRPVVVALCGALRCDLPAWREPDAIAVHQRDVRPVPERPGVLRVGATIHNNASRAQAWPRLTLTLSDVDGRALGMRTFEPAEYLSAPPADVTLASGGEASIGMDIVEPSPHAVAFNFSFH